MNLNDELQFCVSQSFSFLILFIFYLSCAMTLLCLWGLLAAKGLKSKAVPRPTNIFSILPPSHFSSSSPLLLFFAFSFLHPALPPSTLFSPLLPLPHSLLFIWSPQSNRRAPSPPSCGLRPPRPPPAPAPMGAVYRVSTPPLSCLSANENDLRAPKFILS